MVVPEVETVLEQRRLRRRVSRWRIAAIALGTLALATLALSGAKSGPGFGRGAQIARIDIEGMIVDDRKQLELLKKVEDASNVVAVLLAINSPGGTTTGGEALYDAITKLAKKKPVVAVQGTIATSAAYMISLATDRIVARGNTITGSVGVIFQFPEVSEALQKLGVKMHEIKSGELKANPSPFQPLDEPGRRLAEGMVKESQVWFLGLVGERRKINTGAIPGLEAGSIFSGRQALQHKLVDQIGGEADAVAWLEAEKKIAAGLPVVPWEPERDDPFAWLGGSSSLLGRLLGAPPDDFGKWLGLGDVIERLRLDGLLSVWQVG